MPLSMVNVQYKAVLEVNEEGDDKSCSSHHVHRDVYDGATIMDPTKASGFRR